MYCNQLSPMPWSIVIMCKMKMYRPPRGPRGPRGRGLR